MDHIQKILQTNREWSEYTRQKQPEFFQNLAGGQQPEILWIGCSDSRVQPALISGTGPGELFVHRNVGNICYQFDPNFMATLEYAVNELKVRYIVVCGHSGCGAVKAAIEGTDHKTVSVWISGIRSLYNNHQSEFSKLSTPEDKINLLCELNVAQQVSNISETPIVQNAIKQSQPLEIMGMLYSLETGLLKVLQDKKSG